MQTALTKLITLMVVMNTNNRSLPLVWQTIKVLNILVFLAKLLEDVLLGYLRGTGFEGYAQPVFAGLEGRRAGAGLFLEVAYGLTALAVGLALSVGYYLANQINIMGQSKKSNVRLFLLYYPMGTLMIIQLLYPCLILYLSRCFQSLGSLPPSAPLLLVPSSLLLLLATLLASSTRFFNIFFPVILVVTQLLDTMPMAIFVIVASLFFLWRDGDVVSRCGYVCGAAVAAFLVLEGVNGQSGVIGLMHLATWLLFALLVGVAKLCFTIDIGNDQHNNDFLIATVQKLDKGEPCNLSSQTLLKMEQIFRKFYQKNSLNLPQLPPLPTKRLAQLTYQELLQLVDLKLQEDSLRYPNSLGLKKQTLTFRICNLYNLDNSLYEISQFMSEGGGDRSYGERLIRKEVEVVAFDYFFGKQAETERLGEMTTLSQVQQKFVDESMKLLTNINAFWEEINMDALIEEFIQENFYKIAKGIEDLKSLLMTLKKGYKADWQTRALDMLIKLVYPCTPQRIQNELEIQNSDLKQDSLLFFVLRNRSIVQVSPTLLKIINCTNYQAMGNGIAKIIPAEIGPNFCGKEESTGTSGKSSKTGTITPIICGDHLIKVFQISVRLQPKPDLGIEFYYMLKRIEQEEKKAYLYLSTMDLSIKYVSEQFHQIFSLNPAQIQPKLQKMELFLNSLIPSLQANSILPQLQAKKTLKCQLSTSSLRTKQKIHYPETNKFDGIINLENCFASDVLISIQITAEEEIVTSGNIKSKATMGKILKNSSMVSEYFDPEAEGTSKVSAKNTVKELSIAVTDLHKLHDENEMMSREIYCQIPNPYKQKIEQKQAELSEQSHSAVTYSSCTIVLSFLLLALLIIISSLMLFYCWQQNSNIDTLMTNIGLATGHSTNLIYGTFELYSQYIFSAKAKEIQQFVDGLNGTTGMLVSDYLKGKYGHIHEILTLFQNNFTKFYHREIFSNVQYQILYTYMTINTNLSTTALMEYSYNIKLASEEIRILYETAQSRNSSFETLALGGRNPLLFISKNYAIVSAIEAPFNSLPQLIDVFTKSQQTLIICIAALCAFCLLILYLIIHSLRINFLTIKELFYIFSLIEKKQITRIFGEIERSLEIYISQVPKDSLKRLSDLNRAREGAIMVYTSKVRESTKNLKHEYNELKEKEEQQFILTGKIIESNKKMPYLYALENFKWITIIVMIFFAGVGGFYYKTQVDFEEDRINLSFFAEVQWLKFSELKNSADMFHYQVLENVFHQSMPHPQQIREKRSSIQKSLSKNYSSRFEALYRKQSQLLKQSLCEIPASEPLVQNLIDCKEVGLGILEKGYIQAAEYYDYLTQKLKAGEIDMLDIGANQKYMNLFIHIFVREKLLMQFDRFLDAVTENKAILQGKYQGNMIWFGAASLVLATLMALYLFFNFIPNVIKIKKVGIGYFKILPRDTLAKIKVSSYISENKLLKRVSLL